MLKAHTYVILCRTAHRPPKCKRRMHARRADVTVTCPHHAVVIFAAILYGGVYSRSLVVRNSSKEPESGPSPSQGV